MSAELFSGDMADFEAATARCPFLGSLGEAVLADIRASLDEAANEDSNVQAELAFVEAVQSSAEQPHKEKIAKSDTLETPSLEPTDRTDTTDWRRGALEIIQTVDETEASQPLHTPDTLRDLAEAEALHLRAAEQDLQSTVSGQPTEPQPIDRLVENRKRTETAYTPATDFIQEVELPTVSTHEPTYPQTVSKSLVPETDVPDLTQSIEETAFSQTIESVQPVPGEQAEPLLAPDSPGDMTGRLMNMAFEPDTEHPVEPTREPAELYQDFTEALGAFLVEAERQLVPDAAQGASELQTDTAAPKPGGPDVVARVVALQESLAGLSEAEYDTSSELVRNIVEIIKKMEVITETGEASEQSAAEAHEVLTGYCRRLFELAGVEASEAELQQFMGAITSQQFLLWLTEGTHEHKFSLSGLAGHLPRFHVSPHLRMGRLVLSAA